MPSLTAAGLWASAGVAFHIGLVHLCTPQKRKPQIIPADPVTIAKCEVILKTLNGICSQNFRIATECAHVARATQRSAGAHDVPEPPNLEELILESGYKDQYIDSEAAVLSLNGYNSVDSFKADLAEYSGYDSRFQDLVDSAKQMIIDAARGVLPTCPSIKCHVDISPDTLLEILGEVLRAKNKAVTDYLAELINGPEPCPWLAEAAENNNSVVTLVPPEDAAKEIDLRGMAAEMFTIGKWAETIGSVPEYRNTTAHFAKTAAFTAQMTIMQECSASEMGAQVTNLLLKAKEDGQLAAKLQSARDLSTSSSSTAQLDSLVSS